MTTRITRSPVWKRVESGSFISVTTNVKDDSKDFFTVCLHDSTGHPLMQGVYGYFDHPTKAFKSFIHFNNEVLEPVNTAAETISNDLNSPIEGLSWPTHNTAFWPPLTRDSLEFTDPLRAPPSIEIIPDAAITNSREEVSLIPPAFPTTGSEDVIRLSNALHHFSKAMAEAFAELGLALQPRL